jgi:hypothetical protein
MVQLAQFGLQLFLGHGGGMGWRRCLLGLVVQRQSHGALGDIKRVAIQLENWWLVVVEKVECAMLDSCAPRHDETMWVMAMCLPPFAWQEPMIQGPCHRAFATASNYRPCKYLPTLPACVSRSTSSSLRQEALQLLFLCLSSSHPSSTTASLHIETLLHLSTESWLTLVTNYATVLQNTCLSMYRYNMHSTNAHHQCAKRIRYRTGK